MLLDDWESYIRYLSILNKKVRHTVGGLRAWIPFGSDETPVNNSKLKSPYVRHNYFGGNGSKETLWVFSSELLFIVNVPSTERNLEENIKIARYVAFTIMEEYDRRIRYDYENGDICELISDMGEPVVEPIGPVDQKGYGWKYTTRITGERPDYMPEEWDDSDDPNPTNTQEMTTMYFADGSEGLSFSPTRNLAGKIILAVSRSGITDMTAVTGTPANRNQVGVAGNVFTVISTEPIASGETFLIYYRG